MDDGDYGSFDEEETVEASTLATTTPARLQQRTIFGGVAQVQVSPGAASYSAIRSRQRDRNEPPTHHVLDREAIKTWVFPTNYAKRDYQFNMIKKALFSNVLVALPTGLGKTFIAAVVMYNWYRWAPNSKIIFLAPAKPLVTQQIEACYNTCGIPARQLAELTGGVNKARRTAAYKERRVFFLTPQTFRNDLGSGLIKAKEVSCIVIDEAHHATGNYAYVEVVRLMRAETDSFRILALTATPGKTIETVQEVVDGLNISQIEIRNEASIDIRSYTHTKEVETVLLDLSPEMDSIQTKYGKLLKPMMQQLSSMGAGITQDPAKLSAFATREAVNKLQRESYGSGRQRNNAAFAIGGVLSSLAYNMELLNTHGLRPFYDAMLELRYNVKKSSNSNKSRIVKNPIFTSMMLEMEELMQDPSYTGHPKLDHLSGLLLNHFQQAAEHGDLQTRVMIFSSLRVSADAIVTLLKQHEPLLKPTPFFGQQAGKTGSGMKQKEQQQVIENFKKGIYNVIVATSVGEEGLDIGEVDMIICYDTSSSPARMLQRMGRTGRKRDGQVFVLCVRGKEEMNFIKAKDAHRVMQKKIEKGIDIKLSEKVHRILPWNIDPVCEERLLELPDDDKKSDRELKTMAQKKKQVKIFKMPVGASKGFVSAGALTNSAKRRKTKHFDIDAQLWDFEAESNGGVLSPGEQAELNKHFRSIDPDHDGSYINRRAEEGIFLNRKEIRSIPQTVKVEHSRSTKTLQSLLHHQFQPSRLQVQIARYHASPVETIAAEYEGSDEDTESIVPDSDDDDDVRASTSDSYAGLGSFIDDSNEEDDESDDGLNQLSRETPEYNIKDVRSRKPPIMYLGVKRPAPSKSSSDQPVEIFSDSDFSNPYQDPPANTKAKEVPSALKMRLSQLARDSDDDDLSDTNEAVRAAMTSIKRNVLTKRKANSPIAVDSTHKRLLNDTEDNRKGTARKKIRVPDSEEEEDEEW